MLYLIYLYSCYRKVLGNCFLGDIYERDSNHMFARTGSNPEPQDSEVLENLKFIEEQKSCEDPKPRFESSISMNDRKLTETDDMQRKLNALRD